MLFLLCHNSKLDLNLKCLSGSQWDEEWNMCSVVWIDRNQGTEKAEAETS